MLGCQDGAFVFEAGVGVKAGAAVHYVLFYGAGCWLNELLPGAQGLIGFFTLNAGASVFMLKMVRIESGRQILKKSESGTYLFDF